MKSFQDPDWNWQAGEDVHGSSDFDIIMFGKNTKSGVAIRWMNDLI